MAIAGPSVRVEVARSDPGALHTFVVTAAAVRVVLDLLAEVSRQDPSLYFRYSCRGGFCGTCTVLLDGRAVLACQTVVPEGPATVHLAPLGGFPVVRDLVVDVAPFAERWDAVGARLSVDPVGPGAVDGPEAAALAEPAGPRPLDSAGREDIDPSLDCISCGACFAACDLSAVDRLFLGPAALTRAMVVIADPRDTRPAERSVAIGAAGGVEGCHGIGACSLACPKGLDPARAIRRLRRWRITGRA
jgi:succinate dehydrogenase / fumarate reductase iron-sulfur subunit/fumarate reductase iron-sulfur subunit